MAEIKLPVTLLGDIVLRREAGRLIDAAGTDIGLGWGPENAHALKDALNEHAALSAQVARVREALDLLECYADAKTPFDGDNIATTFRRCLCDIVRDVTANVRAALDGEWGAS